MAEEYNLIPVVEIPDFVEEGSEDEDVEYHPSVSWDLSTGDFVLNALGVAPRSDGVEAYKIWCRKAVATERFDCLAYSDGLGTEMEAAREAPDRGAVELAIQRTIEEALMGNPRTISVENFTFTWETDYIRVSFLVNAVNGEEFELEIDVNQ